MGQKVTGMKKGGLIKGLPESPLTTAKRSNDIPGYKAGGKAMGKKKC